MKKTYITPAAQALALSTESNLLGASSNEVKIDASTENQKDGSAALSAEQGWSSEGWNN